MPPLPLLPRGGNDTQLLHHSELVHLLPHLRDLARGNPKVIQPGDRDLLASGGNAHQVTLLRARHGPPDQHLISLGDHVVVGDLPVGKG